MPSSEPTFCAHALLRFHAAVLTITDYILILSSLPSHHSYPPADKRFERVFKGTIARMDMSPMEKKEAMEREQQDTVATWERMNVMRQELSSSRGGSPRSSKKIRGGGGARGRSSTRRDSSVILEEIKAAEDMKKASAESARRASRPASPRHGGGSSYFSSSDPSLSVEAKAQAALRELEEATGKIQGADVDVFCTTSLSAHGSTVRAACTLARDGDILVTGSNDRSFKFWHVHPTVKAMFVEQDAHRGAVLSMCKAAESDYHPTLGQSHFLFTGGSDRVIKRWAFFFLLSLSSLSLCLSVCLCLPASN